LSAYLEHLLEKKESHDELSLIKTHNDGSK